MSVKGIYRHFKGNKYEAFGTAVDSDTQEKYVLYRKLYGDMSCWIRPYDMFEGYKETQNGRVKRFTKIHESDTNIDLNDEIFYISATHSETEEEYEIVGSQSGENGEIYIIKKER